MQTCSFSGAPAVERTEPTLPLGSRTLTEYFEPHWYAAYTCANHEKGVAQQLERRSMECFLPLYESVRRWKDRRVRLRLPLFPGYVFVRFALRDRLRALQIPGVARLVGFDGHPAPVPNEDIEAIRACLNGWHSVRPHRYLHRGQRVRVLSGPLAGLAGIVVREKKTSRLVVSLDLLMRSVSVEFDTADIVPHTAHV
jgi:transcription antitermination factor NusG